MTQKKRQSINLKNDRIRTEYDGIYRNMSKVTFRLYHDKIKTENDTLTDHLMQAFLVQ